MLTKDLYRAPNRHDEADEVGAPGVLLVDVVDVGPRGEPGEHPEERRDDQSGAVDDEEQGRLGRQTGRQAGLGVFKTDFSCSVILLNLNFFTISLTMGLFSEHKQNYTPVHGGGEEEG